MASSFSSTGPIHIFCRIPASGASPRGAASGGTISYLGTAREYPNISVEPSWVPVMNDIAGPTVPADVFASGEDGSINIDINRFDYAVMQSVCNYPRSGRTPGGSARGTNTRLDRGLFALANKNSMEFWFQFSFYNTINTGDYTMIPGYYWPACVVVNTSPEVIGTRDHAIRLMLKPLNWWLAETGSFMLYSNDPSYFTNLPAIS